MKKVLFASAAILLAVISTQAQSDNSISKNDNKPSKEERKEIKKEKKQGDDDVSYQSKQEFFRVYGDQPGVKWTRSKSFDEAAFNLDGVQTIAFYGFDSKLVGTTSIKTFGDLPADGQKKILKDYKDYTVKSVVFFDDNENNDADMILYNSRFDDEDNYFVELQKDNKTIVVQVTMDGETGYFTAL